jgi:AcrR family transcriptional regulator
MPRVKRREREIERTRQDILDAAARVFARHGFAGAKMQEIAREAGYTAPSLYTYFPGKEALFATLFSRFLGDVLALFERPLPKGLTLEQAVEIVLGDAMGLCDERRDALTAFASVASAGLVERELKAAGADTPAVAAIVARLTGWIEAHAGPGELGTLAPDEAAYLLFGVTNAMYMRWQHSGRAGTLRDLVPRLLELFVAALRAGEARR